MTLEWKKRCKKDTTIVSERKIWETKDGSYKVIFSHITLAEGTLPDRWYAIRVDEDGTETILSNNKRAKHTAVDLCEKDAKERGR